MNYQLFFHLGEDEFFLLEHEGIVVDSGFHFIPKISILGHQLVELLAVPVNVEEELIVHGSFDKYGELFGNYEGGSLLLVLEHLGKFLLYFMIKNTCSP